MFEDSTFESNGRIKTRSRRWMLAAFTFNGSILITFVLLPLVYPGALPQHPLPSLLVAPEAPKPQTPPEPAHIQPAQLHNHSEFDQGRLTAPPTIPREPLAPAAPELPFVPDGLGAGNGSDIPGADGTRAFNNQPAIVLRKPSPSTVRLPSHLVESTVIYKTIPQYPPIAKATHTEGTVVLQAMISKTGTIEGLHVI